MEKKQKVVIIGHGYTSRLGIIRSLAELDCEMTVIAMAFHNWFGRFVRFDWGKPIDCYSKYVSRMMYCKINDGEELIQLLLSKCTDRNQKVVIIPDSDFSAMVIDNNQHRLRDFFLFPHIHYKEGMVEHWMDKSVQKQLASQIGMNVAQGIVVEVSEHHYSLPVGIHYPCFTKSLETVSGGKQFLRKCEDEKELISLLNRISDNYNTKVLIEDFKQIDTEYAVVGVSNGKDVLIPGVLKFIENSKSHFGIAREGIVMPTAGFESILSQFTTFLRTICFCGLFDIDFYESEGKLYFGELNLRFGGSGYAVTKMGVNLPGIFVKYLTGESIENMSKSISSSASYSNERMCIDDWRYGYISKKDCMRKISSAEIHFIDDVSDPLPQRMLQYQFVGTELGRLRKKIKRLWKSMRLIKK